MQKPLPGSGWSPSMGSSALTQPLHLLLSHSLWVVTKIGDRGRFLERGGGWAEPAWLVSLIAEGAGRMTRTSEELSQGHATLGRNDRLAGRPDMSEDVLLLESTK